jgi:hypothetical protein
MEDADETATDASNVDCRPLLTRKGAGYLVGRKGVPAAAVRRLFCFRRAAIAVPPHLFLLCWQLLVACRRSPRPRSLFAQQKQGKSRSSSEWRNRVSVLDPVTGRGTSMPYQLRPACTPVPEVALQGTPELADLTW